MRPLAVCTSVLALVTATRLTEACESATVALAVSSAERLERRHAIGAAIALRTPLLGCPRGPHTVGNRLALAADHASLGEYSRAAELIESLAQGAPVEGAVVAGMHAAVSYRLALRDLPRAQADVAWLLGAVGVSTATTDRALEVGLALEATRMWTEATLWYQRLVGRAKTHGLWRVQARALLGMGRAYEGLGDLASARSSFEATAALWSYERDELRRSDIERAEMIEPFPAPPAVPPVPLCPPRPRRRGRFAPLQPMCEEGIDDTNSQGSLVPEVGFDDSPLAPFAEARFRLTSFWALRFVRVPPPRFTGSTGPEFDRWVVRDVTPWARELQVHVDGMTVRLGGVIVLGVPRWTIAAAAYLSLENLRFVWLIRSMPRPPGFDPATETAFGLTL